MPTVGQASLDTSVLFLFYSIMSDDPATLATPVGDPTRVRAGVIEHWCEHPGCRRWGSFGLPYRDRVIWLCGEHERTGPTTAGLADFTSGPEAAHSI